MQKVSEKQWGHGGDGSSIGAWLTSYDQDGLPLCSSSGRIGSIAGHERLLNFLVTEGKEKSGILLDCRTHGGSKEAVRTVLG